MTSRRGFVSWVLFALALAPASADPPPANPPVKGGGTIEVVDEAGKPLRSARLAPASPGGEGSVVLDPVAAPGLEAGERGDFALPKEAPEGGGAWVVWAPGRAPRRVTADSGATLVLEKGGKVTGGVRWSGGRVAGGVALLVEPLGEREPAVAVRLTTDKLGRYETDLLQGKIWRVSLLRPDGRWIPLRTAAPGGWTADLVAPQPGGVTGRLIDAKASGSVGVPGIALRLLPLPRPREGVGVPVEAKTDAEGKFVLLDLAAGVYELELLDPDWMFDQPAARIAVTGQGVVHQASWFVARRVNLAGSVVGREAKPVVGARVHLLADPREPVTAANPGERPDPVTTDLAGRFRFTRLVPGPGWRLLVEAKDYAPRVSPDFEIGPSAETHLNPVALSTGWSLDVEVRDASARVVPGVPVRLVAAEHPTAGLDPDLKAFLATAKTDGKGVASFSALADEDMWLTFSLRGHLPVAERILRPATSARLFHRVLLATAPALEGTVHDAGGRPAADLGVRARPRGLPGQTERVGVTKADGSFALEDLPPQAVDVDVLTPGGRSLLHVEGVVPGEERLDLALPPLQTLAGTAEGLRVDGPAAVVLLEARARAPGEEDPRWLPAESRTLPRGVPTAGFRFEGLAPGEYAVRVTQGALDTEPQPVRLEEDALEDLRLTLPESGSVAGAVVDGRGLPALGARVALTRLRGDGEAAQTPNGPLVAATDDRGEFLFGNVAPGLWRVAAGDVGLGSDLEVVRLLEGESVVVRDLSLAAGGTLEGRVEDARGRPVDGARLSALALDRDLGPRLAGSGSDGGYRFTGLAPGTYEVSCWDGPEVRFSRAATVVVVDRDVTTLNFVAEGSGEIEGTVLRGGRRAPGVTLVAERTPDEGETLAVAERVLTDVGGAFHLRGLPAGRYRLTLEDGTARTGGDVNLGDGDHEQVDLELWEGRLSGEVLRNDGTPEAGAEVTARSSRTVAGVLGARTRTDPRGRFSLSGIPVGRYDLVARGAGGLLGVRRQVSADLPGADRPTTVVLAAGGTLVIDVRGVDGRPAAGARITLEARGAEETVEVAVVTGPTGRVRVDGVTAGRVRIHAVARDAGSVFAWADAEEGTVTPVKLDLAAAGNLRLKVSGAELDVLRRSCVEVRQVGKPDVLVRCAAVENRRDWGAAYRWRPEGLEVRDLAAGDYEVAVDAGPRFGVGRAVVRVRPGESANAVLELRPAER